MNRFPPLVPGLLTVLALGCSESSGRFSGDVSVVFETTGQDPDSNGYIVVLDGDSVAVASPSDTIVLKDLPFGSHRLALRDVSSNCLLSGPSPHAFSVSGDIRETLPVVCTAVNGEIRLVLRQTGISSDLNGVILQLDHQFISAFVLDTAIRLPPGTHVASLTDVAPHCTLSPELPQSVPLQPGEHWTLEWEIRCDLKAQDRIIFNVQSHTAPTDAYTIRLDGTDRRSLIPPHFICSCGRNAAATNSGSRIAWQMFGIMVMNADSTGVTKIAEENTMEQPAWSPDESRIVFTDTAWTGNDLYLVNADGTGRMRLTHDSSFALTPNWSPDGQSIVYAGKGDSRTFLYHIWRIDVGGGGKTRLTSFDDHHYTPQYSPDGSRIAFSVRGPGDTDGQIYLMNNDGSNQTRLTTLGGFNPVWAPSGTAIAFSRLVDNFQRAEIWIMDSDGGHQRKLLASGPGELLFVTSWWSR